MTNKKATPLNPPNDRPEPPVSPALPHRLTETAAWLEERGVTPPLDAAVILGSGLGTFAGRIEDRLTFRYGDIPHFPLTSVEGHAGELIAGTVSGRSVLAFGGRIHRYEGFSFEQTALPVYLSAALSCGKLIVSNAAGAVNTAFRVGDLMVVENIIRQNLRITPPAAERYRCDLREHADRAYSMAQDLGLPVHRGTYIYVTGPNYETQAEIRAYREMGADAVGMSTAPELAEAARLGLPAVAISLISNMASGVVSGARLNHTEVKEAAAARHEDFDRLVTRLIEEW